MELRCAIFAMSWIWRSTGARYRRSCRSGIDRAFYLAAAKVGGIVANNTYPADFIYENMMIESNIIHAAHLHNVNKLLFPRFVLYLSETGKAADGRKASCRWGTLEPTNEPYAIAKIAGIKLCESPPQPAVRSRLPFGDANQPVIRPA